MNIEIVQGDCMDVMAGMAEKSVQCCITSPPYWGLRDYGVDGQLGLEPTPDEYVARMVDVFRGVRRVLKDDGTVWLNLGDSYVGGGRGGGIKGTKQQTNKGSLSEQIRAGKFKDVSGLKHKNFVGIPWRVAFALQADGWYLRSDIIWHKPNPMPESVTDRPTKSHEYIFLLSKNGGKSLLWYNTHSREWAYSKPDYFAIKGIDYYIDEKGDNKSYWRSHDYYYDSDAIKEPMADVSVRRLSQDIESQAGSDRVPGKTNGPMKAVGMRPVYGAPEGNMPGGKNQTGRRNGGKNVPCSGYCNKRTVWTVTTQPYKEAHFATFPEKLIEPCIKAGCPEGGIILDPFAGAGTVGVVCERWGRNHIGIELNPEYREIAMKRITAEQSKMALFDNV